MLLRSTTPLRRRPVDSDVARWLQAKVEALAVPRHRERQAREKARNGEALARELGGLGYATPLQGPYR
ncbi:MAG: hypothetical protein AAF602_32090, partial [Myxococcota bacterium]